MTRRPTPESGFTLLELMLVVGISALLLLGVTRLTQSWIDAERATGAGTHLSRVSHVVQRYVEARWAILPPTNDALTAGGEWAALGDILRDEGLLTAGVLRSPLNTPLRISYNNAGGIYRATIFATQNIPNNMVLRTARQAGNFGGSVTSVGDVNTARGAFGQWAVPIANIGGFNCPVTPRSGCLVALISYTEDLLTGPYLYREDLGNPDLNTMFTDLLMNGRNINGAGNIAASELNVATLANLGDTNVAGTATFNGPATANAGMTVNAGMDVSGDSNFSGNLTVNSGTVNTVALNATTVQAPTFRTNQFDAQNLTVGSVGGGNLVVNDAINVNSNVTASGEVYTNTLNAGQINMNNGTLTTGRMDVRNTLEINGTVNITSGTVIVDRLVADRCVEIHDSSNPGNYNDYGNCP